MSYIRVKLSSGVECIVEADPPRPVRKRESFPFHAIFLADATEQDVTELKAVVEAALREYLSEGK